MTRNCDIVVPTYNNEAVMQHTLDTLLSQVVPDGWRVRLIVSDDGSHDATVKLVHQHSYPPSWADRVVLTSSHTGPADARNRGIAESDAQILFLLGADILLCPGVLAAHLAFHTSHPSSTDAALGVIRWDPRIIPTPFMEWMVHGGQQNDFDALLGNTTADPRHFFYGSHLSLKRAILGDTRFSSEFRLYGWEDLDLGRQLADTGLTLHVLHDARALHRHLYTAQAICKRQWELGRSMYVYQRRHPAQRLIPQQRWGRLLLGRILVVSGALEVLRVFVEWTGRWLSTPRLFLALTAGFFWKGVYEARRSTIVPF